MNAMPHYVEWKLTAPPSDDDYERVRAHAVDNLAERDRYMHLADWIAEDPFALDTLASLIQSASDYGKTRDCTSEAVKARQQFELYLGTKIDREIARIREP